MYCSFRVNVEVREARQNKAPAPQDALSQRALIAAPDCHRLIMLSDNNAKGKQSKNVPSIAIKKIAVVLTFAWPTAIAIRTAFNPQVTGAMKTPKMDAQTGLILFGFIFQTAFARCSS